MKNLHSIFQVFSVDLVSKVMMGLGAILLIRYMPPHEYGIYTIALSLTMVVIQTLATCFNRVYILGFERLGLEADQTPFLGFQLATVLVISIVGLPARGMLGGAYWFAVILSVASILSEFSKTSFQRELRFVRFSLVEITRSGLFLVSVLGLILFVGQRTPAWAVLLVQAGAMFAAFAVASFHSIRWSQIIRLGEAWKLGRTILSKEYRVLYGYFFVLSIFSQLDIFMLKWLGRDGSVATYGAAARYYNLLLLSLGAIHTVLLPMLQRVNSEAEWKELLGRLNRLLFFFVPVVLLGAFASGWIIPWIDHGKYPEAVTIFRILAMSTIVSFAFSPYVNLLMRFEDFRFLFALVCVASGLCMGLHALLIPAFGPRGAAVATLLSFGTVNLATYLRAKVHYQKFALAPREGLPK